MPCTTHRFSRKLNYSSWNSGVFPEAVFCFTACLRYSTGSCSLNPDLHCSFQSFEVDREYISYIPCLYPYLGESCPADCFGNSYFKSIIIWFRRPVLCSPTLNSSLRIARLSPSNRVPLSLLKRIQRAQRGAVSSSALFFTIEGPRVLLLLFVKIA